MPDLYGQLKLFGKAPTSYPALTTMIEEFYSCIKVNPKAASTLSHYNVTVADATAQLAKLVQVKQARIDHAKEEAESEQAMQAKDAALAKLDGWMSTFYKTARVALEQKPQLLEALGIVVKS